MTIRSIVSRSLKTRPILVLGGVLGIFYAGWLSDSPSAAERPKLLPAPLHDETPSAQIETAVFAGGCFWGTQGVFQRVDGVLATYAGYTGGSADTATYEQTESGSTGHAEAVKVVYNPNKVSYGTLLRIFFSVAHDPTQLNRQGSDVGTQYRSAIFAQTPTQAALASDYIEQLKASALFETPIVTKIETEKAFYKAEEYHQDYLVHNQTQPYIAFVEQPKVDALMQLFPSFWRSEPLLKQDQRG